MLSSWFLKFYARGRGRLQQVPVHTLQLVSSPQFKGIVNGEAIGLNGAYLVKLACNAVPDNQFHNNAELNQLRQMINQSLAF